MCANLFLDRGASSPVITHGKNVIVGLRIVIEQRLFLKSDEEEIYFVCIATWWRAQSWHNGIDERARPVISLAQSNLPFSLAATSYHARQENAATCIDNGIDLELTSL